MTRGAGGASLALRFVAVMAVPLTSAAGNGALFSAIARSRWFLYFKRRFSIFMRGTRTTLTNAGRNFLRSRHGASGLADNLDALYSAWCSRSDPSCPNSDFFPRQGHGLDWASYFHQSFRADILLRNGWWLAGHFNSFHLNHQRLRKLLSS